MLPLVFWICFPIIILFPPTYLSIYYCGVCILLMYLMRSRLHPQMSSAWFCAWTALFSNLRVTIPPHMHISWYIFFIALIFGLRATMHPERSLGRFVLWTALILVLRFTVYALYLAYWMKPDKSNLFPFNLFSGRWRLSQPRWSPASARLESEDLNGLCKHCRRFIAGSSLITGSGFLFSRLREWHESWESFEELRASASEGSQPCHVCKLLWYSLSETRRSEITKNSPARDKRTSRCKIKVWEERPLSGHTYIQLCQGSAPVGARLLARRKHFTDNSTPSSGCSASSTDSPEHTEQAKMWLQKCIDFHSLCNAVGNVPHIMPSRLLYIEYSSQSHPTVLLVEVKEADHKIEYLAFSHCWGDCEAFKLSTANYNTSLEGIKFFELSKNSQHAIQITLRLGYSYIWIDSLCIIQDSPLDWATESAKMGNVYSNAVCTIASTGSSSGDGGCFHERDYHSLRPYGIRVTLLGEFVGSIYIWRDDVFDFERNVDRAPLNKRGWVLQERLLSRRILHFGADMLYWECWQRSASEVNTNGYIYKKYPDDFEDDYTPPLSGVSTRTDLEWAERSGQGTTWQMQEMIRRRPPPPLLEPDDPPTSHTIWQRKRGFWKEIRKSSTDPWGADSTEGNLSGLRAAFTSLRNDEFSHNDVGMSSFSHYWYEIVEPYTRGRLSFSKDKQVALFGIVKEIKDATKYTYLAGLWKEHLLTSLLWFATEGPGRRLMTEPQQTGADDSTQADGTTDKPTTYIAPTWSWVSLEGTVGVDLLPDNSLGGLSVERRLAEIVTFPEEPNRELNSSIPVGHLRVQGHLCKISKVKRGDTLSYIKIGNSIRNSARLFPDIAEDDISNDPDLFCLPILDLKRNTSGRSKKEIQGLVLRRTKRGGNSFERVGFFTSRMDQWFQSRKMFTEAPIEIVEIV